MHILLPSNVHILTDIPSTNESEAELTGTNTATATNIILWKKTDIKTLQQHLLYTVSEKGPTAFHE